jgi:MinD-like ATPase involved in chromosome partitioning or flagellar assembly
MIYTFYSYKGGVGRSMALANVAEILCNHGLRVVMIDWDLEAAGLENFFKAERTERDLVRSQIGLIDLLETYKRQFPLLPIPSTETDTNAVLAVLREHLSPISAFLYPIYPPQEDNQKGVLWLLSAGWRSGDRFRDYALQVQNFDWSEFYSAFQGEAFFEWMREQLLAPQVADVVLIDSRTGVTEMGGVCTRQMANVVVLFTTANQQSLDGTKTMAQSLKKDALREKRKGALPSLLLVPSRVERSESTFYDEFASAFEKEFRNFVDAELRLEKSAFNTLRIPYEPYYAYTERVAVREPDRPIAADLIEAYQRLADTLARLALEDHPIRRLDLQRPLPQQDPEIAKLRRGTDELASRFGAELEKAALDWNSSGRDPAYLYRGSLLARAETWLEKASPTNLQREFISASLEEKGRAEEAEQARRDHVTRSTLFVSIGVVALAIALISLGILVFQFNAQQTQFTAQQATQAAQEIQLGVQGTQLAVQQATVEGFQTQTSPQGQSSSGG